ncbi:putative death-receptor fusion protein-domain-containing protein [Nemania sp. FL0916]|nr:putative death-receptor fusion protein-domain-containing protein [Nemania sp. FL0916]
MGTAIALDGLPNVRGTSFNQKAAVIWLEQQSEELQSQLVEHVFNELLANAAKPKQSSGNACSKLCGFVENCWKSHSSVLNSFVFAPATVTKLFDFFLEWNEQDAHRSMRLVLDCIVSAIIWNPNADISNSIRDSILHDTISAIILQAPRPSTKSSMIALDHFLQKKVISLIEVLQVYSRCCEDVCHQEAMRDSFISQVFAWMELQHVWTVAGKLLVTILTQPWCQDDNSSKLHPSTWHRLILNGLKANPELLEPIKVYIFMPLFRTDPKSTLIYLDELTSLQKLTVNDSQGWDVNAMIWVALLEAGKKTGVVAEPNQDSKHEKSVAGQLPIRILDILMCHKSHEARASGLSILVASPTTTRPYSSETLKLLQKHLPSFHEDVDPKIRYDVLGHSRNIIRRLHNSIDILRKELARTSDKPKNTPMAHGNANLTRVELPAEALYEHEKFIDWYARFLKEELVPTVSYQRHITSLKAINYFLKASLTKGDENSATRWPASLLIDAMWFRSVLDLLMDPYDDVREFAASLIMLLQSKGSMSGPPARIPGLYCTPLEELRAFCQKADELALKTARADHCDGAARSQELLFCWSSDFKEAENVLERITANLERKLDAAERDLAAAVLQAPVHGDFASLRYIWSSLAGLRFDEHDHESLDGFQDRAISSCRRVWQIVQHILCDDSPEGHLPEELQQIEGLDTKDLLSYSFRAIHESSNLMRTIAQTVHFDRNQGNIAPSPRNFEDIGNLSFEQLSTLRHRGAFSTVSQTFTACCQLVQSTRAHKIDDVDLLKEWYEGALNCIHTQGSTTRRSAGIPAIIVGILSSRTSSPSFSNVITKLQEIGQKPAFVSETDGSNLAQVHALNCLKDVFKSSLLSHLAEPYLTDCLQLAALSLQSEVWAIRNCGLLLLRSLIDNLFGTNENKAAMEAGWDGRTIRIPYHKFEALPSLLLDLLELGKASSSGMMGAQTAEAVFPALDIIRRAGPPEGYLQTLYDAVSWYLGSHIWHVREIAARTLCSLLLTSAWLQSIKQLILGAGQDSNKLHGALLTIKFILERLLQTMPEQLSGENMDAVYEILDNMSASNDRVHTCTEVRAVHIDILNFMVKAAPAQSQGSLWNTDVTKVQQSSGHEPLALLHIRTGEAIVRQALRTLEGKMDNTLQRELEFALATDTNVACTMLSAIADRGLPETEAARSRLVTIYVHACLATTAPEPRTVALENLATLLDAILGSAYMDGKLDDLPPEEAMVTLWLDLNQKPLNPSLSDAIIRVSGPLVAISLVRERGHIDKGLGQRLSNWGAMIGDAGMADRTFDTRIAAAEAIRSLSSNTRFPAGDPHNESPQIHRSHLPWLLALYDALMDDDVDIREAAAEAASSILGLALVPVEAGARLLRWLAAYFGYESDFLVHLVGRMVGHNFGSTCFVATHATEEHPAREDGLDWVSAKTQLAEAMRFDDSLFVVEEHNQYTDEVREAKRWTNAFLSLELSKPERVRHAAHEALAEWTKAGLRALTEIIQSRSVIDGDGPLGWTSKPEVFAICARVLICASAAAKLEKAHSQGNKGDEAGVYAGISEELSQFWKLGRGKRARVHPQLLSMCGIEE